MRRRTETERAERQLGDKSALFTLNYNGTKTSSDLFFVLNKL